MVKLKNYNAPLVCFVLFLTFLLHGSCSTKRQYVSRIEATKISVGNQKANSGQIESFIKPYREEVQAQMSVKLAYAPEAIDKAGEWQTELGNLFAAATIAIADSISRQSQNTGIDFCMLNAGGIRAMIPKGDITVGTAYEIMPFENNIVIVEMAAKDIRELLQYFISDKRPHPLSGLSFTIGKDKLPYNIRINGAAYDPLKTYSVATSDYLYNGGDNMFFFNNGGKMYDTNYKVRDALVAYFKKRDTIRRLTDNRILVEQ